MTDTCKTILTALCLAAVVPGFIAWAVVNVMNIVRLWRGE